MSIGLSAREIHRRRLLLGCCWRESTSMAHMTVADLGIATKVFWANFLQSQTNPSATAERLYDTFRIGDSPESANEGAQLIIAGIKTTTSSLLWEYEKLRKPLPFIGSLSILEDGQGEPVCIVETIWLKV